LQQKRTRHAPKERWTNVPDLESRESGEVKVQKSGNKTKGGLTRTFLRGKKQAVRGTRERRMRSILALNCIERKKTPGVGENQKAGTTDKRTER